MIMTKRARAFISHGTGFGRDAVNEVETGVDEGDG